MPLDAERHELDYVRRPSPRRARRWRLTLLVCALIAVPLGVAHFWPGKRVYQAGPVSHVHAFFGHDCAQCHDRTWQPGLRLFFGDDIRSASDGSCQRCHEGPVHNQEEATHPACASCHREHIRSTPLARVADQHCTSCHGDLSRHLAPTRTTAFAGSIASFAEHPEFALWLRQMRDPGSVRFNHAVHLAEEGVFTLVDSTGERVRRRLDCQSCHTRDATGRYMQPIRYEKHCQECHPLAVQLTALPVDAEAQRLGEAFRAESAPHQPPVVVRGVLRERLLTRFAAYGRDKLGWRPLAGEPLLPGQPGTPPIGKEQFEWTSGQLREIERVLFNLEGGCRYCHTYEGDRADGLPKIKAARINERELPDVGVTSGLRLDARWLPHSRFNHEPHRFLDCQECHGQATTSRETADVLLPRVAQCQSCHQPAKNVRSDCVTCHTYHPADAKQAFRGSVQVSQCPGRAGSAELLARMPVANVSR